MSTMMRELSGDEQSIFNELASGYIEHDDDIDVAGLDIRLVKSRDGGNPLWWFKTPYWSAIKGRSGPAMIVAMTEDEFLNDLVTIKLSLLDT